MNLWTKINKTAKKKHIPQRNHSSGILYRCQCNEHQKPTQFSPESKSKANVIIIEKKWEIKRKQTNKQIQISEWSRKTKRSFTIGILSVLHLFCKCCCVVSLLWFWWHAFEQYPHCACSECVRINSFESHLFQKTTIYGPEFREYFHNCSRITWPECIGNGTTKRFALA